MRTLILFLLISYNLNAQQLITNVVSSSFNHSNSSAPDGKILNSLNKNCINPYSGPKEELDSIKSFSKIDEYLDFQHKLTSKDQLFVHTDRNKYRPGDTIYFRAYVRNRFTSKFESGSLSMYAMLCNDQNEIVDSSRYRIQGYTSSGWMTIPIDAQKGKYHFIAFTSLMQNFDPMEAFRLDIFVDTKIRNLLNFDIEYYKENYHPGDVLEAKIKLTDKKGLPIDRQKFKSSIILNNYTIDTKTNNTNSSGEAVIKFTIPDTTSSIPKLQLTIKKEDDNESFTKNFDIHFNIQNFELKFLPEGGSLVTGLEQKIGFNATNIRGESVNIEGLLKDVNGKILDTIKSGIYGPGLFICKPEQGMYVELTKGYADERIWPLPKIDGAGISMSVKQINAKTIVIELQSSNYNGETLIVSGMMNVTRIFSKELSLNKKRRIVINTENLPSGIAQITLFNHELKPIAERLFYINDDKRLIFNIKTDYGTYKPGQETEITVTLADEYDTQLEGFFSISVIDSLSGYKSELFTPGIEYTLNYNPYFLENLPSKVLSIGIENLPDEQKDLMLMVYGWKKYNWDFEQMQQTKIRQLTNYDLLQIKIPKKNQQETKRLNLVSLPFEEGVILNLLTDKNGEIILPLDSFPESTGTIMMLPETKNEKKISTATIGIPYNQKYFTSSKLLASGPMITNNNNEKKQTDPNPVILTNEDDIEIQEVTIKGQRNNEEEFINEYEKLYNGANIHSISGKNLSVCGDFDEALRKAVPTMKYGRDEEGNVCIHINPRISIAKVKDGVVVEKLIDPALIVLDGNPLVYDGYNVVKYINPSDLQSISVLKGYYGYGLYGVDAIGGVIFVTTKVGNSNSIKSVPKREPQDPNDQMGKTINLYRPNIEYYHPTKTEIDKDPFLQTNPTIYWQSEVYFDGEDPVKIKFPNLKNNKNGGKVMIRINGVSFNNLAGSGKANYLVRGGN